ncbi:MAG: DUF401 family protein [Candidatus Wallbacteria bacterium]
MPLIKISLIFVAIILASRYSKVKLWQCLAIGAICLGFMFGMQPYAVFYAVVSATFSYKTIELLLVLYGIAVFEYTLRVSGMLSRLIVSLKKIFKDDRFVLALLPAFLGFLPAPGGALFSAPLVDEAAKNVNISQEDKSFINYWYRHIWETTFPLFPGLILLTYLADIPLSILARATFPIILINIASGIYVVFSKKLELKESIPAGESYKFNHKAIGELFKNLFPILIIIAGTLFFKINIIILIIGAILWTFVQAGIKTTAEIKKILVETLYSQNLMLIVAIMIFSKMLEDSGAAPQIPKTFIEWNVPYFFIYMLMPLTLGFFTGINQAFVGMCVPILKQFAGGTLGVNQTAFLYISGCAGVMLSPVHLCLILTLNYFKANIWKFYRMLLVPVLGMLAYAAAVGAFLK